MRILVKVTKDVLERSKMCGILNGQLHTNTNCGIAVAIRDLFPHANVWHYHVYLFLEQVETKVYLPHCATSFINEFDSLTPDQRVRMTPFSFELEVPEYVIEKIGLSQIYKVLSESSTLQMVM